MHVLEQEVAAHRDRVLLLLLLGGAAVSRLGRLDIAAAAHHHCHFMHGGAVGILVLSVEQAGQHAQPATGLNPVAHEAERDPNPTPDRDPAEICSEQQQRQ